MPSHVIIALLLALSGIVSIVAMLWMIANARTVARAFDRPRNDLEPGPQLAMRPPPRRRVWMAILLFNLGWIAAVAIWTLGVVKVNDAPATAENRPAMPRSVPSHD